MIKGAGYWDENLAHPIIGSLKLRQGGTVVQAVGSTAVREAILRHQPMLSVHGHIHESEGIVHLLPMLCLNPGSGYSDDVLQRCCPGIDGKEAEDPAEPAHHGLTRSGSSSDGTNATSGADRSVGQ
jgi:hypothetical protein